MKLTQDDLLLMSALERISGVTPKDCIVHDNVISFLVKEQDVGKAIGKSAQNVKELESRLKKRVEIFSYDERPEVMVAKALEVKVASANKKGTKLFVTIEGTDKKKIFGNMGRVRKLKEFIERNYDLEVVLN